MSVTTAAARPRGGSSQIALIHSLKGRLLIFFLLLSLVPLLTVAVLAFVRSQSALEESAFSSLATTGTLQAKIVDTWTQERIGQIGFLASTDRVSSMDPETATDAIDQYFAEWGIYETIILTGMDGIGVASNDRQEYNLIDRAYMRIALTGQPACSDPIISRATGNVVVVVAVPVRSEGRQVGVLLGTLSPEVVVESLRTAWTGQTGDAYLVNGDGVAFTAPRQADEARRRGLFKERAELELKVDSFGAQEAIAGRAGISRYRNYLGNEVLGSYQPISVPGTQWNLLVEVDEAEALAAAHKLQGVMLTIGGIAAVVVALVAFLIANSLAKPMVDIASVAGRLALGDVNQQIAVDRKDEIGAMADAFRQMIAYQQEMADAAGRIAEGDLTADVTPLSERDALGNAFAKMLASLRNLIGQVQDGAGGVAGASSQINAAAEQTAQASQQVAATIQQVAQGTAQQTTAITQATSQVEQMAQAIDGVAKGAQEQARAVERASASVTQMTGAIDRVAVNAQSASAASQQAAGRAEEGASTVNHTVQAMATIKDTVSDVGRKVLQMQQHSAQIGVIVETIDDIAEQTNLLALNGGVALLWWPTRCASWPSALARPPRRSPP